MPIQQMFLGVPLGTTPPGQQVFTTVGSATWTVPAGVTSVSIVCVGAGHDAPGTSGNYASGGGGLGYKNNYSVTPGATINIQVGDSSNATLSNRDSWVNNATTVKGGGASRSWNGAADSAGGYVGDGGGNGGVSGESTSNYFGNPGGGGAGGYAGDGGDGGLGGFPTSGNQDGADGSGGGGGGGGGASSSQGGSGGGVGLLGQGSSGAGGAKGTSYNDSSPGGGGSGGANGTISAGGLYGGGAHGGSGTQAGGTAGDGGIRIMWPGDERSYPSTRTADE